MRPLIGVTINGKFYNSIKAVPVYRAVRTYTRHMGPEQHAVLGNLRWILERSDPSAGNYVEETQTDLLACFSFDTTPQGGAYWLRIVNEMDKGKLIYNSLRAEYKLDLAKRKQEQQEQS